MKIFAFWRRFGEPVFNRFSNPRLAYDLYTVVTISIRTSNFGWAHPNRVVSQAVFKKFAARHPEFGAEREVRASPWGFALIASRLDAPRVPKKTFFKKHNSKKLGQVGGRVSAGMSERTSALNALKQ